MKTIYNNRFFLAFLFFVPAIDARAGVEVLLNGVEGSLKDEVLTAITLERQKNHERMTENRIRILFEHAHTEIMEILQANGYYRAMISSSLEEGRTPWTATYNIELNEPLLISEIHIEISGEGKDDPAFIELINSYPVTTGSQLNHGAYESGKKEIQKLAFGRGYFDGKWEQHSINIDLEKYTAVIFIKYDTGVRYTFGEIDIPETELSPEIIQRYINFKPGDPYDSGLLVQLQKRLRDSSYFRDIDVSPRLTALEGRSVPVSISLQPRPRNAYNLGIGYGTDTGPRLTAGWESRYFNTHGHRINADLKIAPVLSSMSSAYLIPFFRQTESELGILASLAREDTDTSLSNIFKTGLQHRTTRWGWNETVRLTYQFEDFEVGGESNTNHLLIPGIGYQKAEYDSPVYTREGFRLGFDLRGAGEGFISDISFIQAHIQGKYITSLGERSRIITRGEIGATATSDFDNLPASLRFFAGGDNSIRGFDFKSLGPVNDTGEVVGGRYLVVGSAEYEYRVFDKWSIAAFTDFGNAYNHEPEKIEYSAGAGVRWQSPVGLIRVDLAAGISQDDTPLRVHISIGPDL
jgi:translocation and assembly module TamA